MSKDRLLYLNDRVRNKDDISLSANNALNRINSKIEFFNDATGERIWTPLHNKTVIAGGALTLAKLFNFDRLALNRTPTYDRILGLDEGNIEQPGLFPTITVKDNIGNTVGVIEDESQRVICGFCLGQGGSGSDISDVFDVPYASWITPDNLVPFRYPLASTDNVDETMYKGKKTINLSTGQTVVAYYFKEFSNSPQLVQNYVSTIGTFTDEVTAENVYSDTASADKAQSYVELHLKITKDDVREFFYRHDGIESARINQISLVTAWKKPVSVTKLNSSGSMTTATYEYFQDVRPFSVANIPSEILSDQSKSISCIYTLYC